MIPQDPVMLLSFLNMKLRDVYDDLDDLIEDLGLDLDEITTKMATIDYVYDPKSHQFR